MKFIREIKAVGLRDWLWFVFVIRRDEFHKSLVLIRYSLANLDKCYDKRHRAHIIDMKLSELR